MNTSCYCIQIIKLGDDKCVSSVICAGPLEQRPVLKVEKSEYNLGDTLRGNCTSPPSSPPVNLTLYVNGNKVGTCGVTVCSGYSIDKQDLSRCIEQLKRNKCPTT